MNFGFLASDDDDDDDADDDDDGRYTTSGCSTNLFLHKYVSPQICLLPIRLRWPLHFFWLLLEL